IMVAIFAGMSTLVNRVHGLPERFSPAALQLIADGPSPPLGPCDYKNGDAYICAIGDTHADESFAIIGDSYADALLSGLNLEATRRALHGLAFVTPGCYPLLDVQMDQQECTSFMRKAFMRIQSMRNLNVIILIGRWTTALESNQTGMR